MRHHKGWVFLCGLILNASQVYGLLEINLPQDNVGYYQDTTHLNCTDTPFIVANGYSWSKDSAVVYDSGTGDATGTGKYTSSHGTGYFTLEIVNTSLSDKGDYKCRYNFDDDTGTLNIQAKGSGQGKVEDDKLVITLTEFYPNTTTVSSVICNGKNFTGTSEVTDAGELFNLVWTSDASVDTSDLNNDCKVSLSSISPYELAIAVDIAPSTTLSPTTVTTSMPPTNCTCECKCKCKKMVIASIVFGSLGAINLPVVIGGTVTENFGKTTALVVDIIGIVCDVISLGLGIGVEAGDCCEDCCEDSDCCKDDSEKCERNWIEKTALAFIIIGALVGIVACVIFCLVWSNRMGPGNNAYKAKEAKHPDENHGMTGTSM